MAQDVLQLLKADHDKVRKLLKELENGPSNKSKAVLKKLAKELEVHTDIEEKIVYPAYRAGIGTEEVKVMVEEARAEHMLADILLKQLVSLRAGSPEFQGKAAVLKESVEHHADEEEKEMFPQMRKHFLKEDLVDLGRQVEEFKRGGMEVGRTEKTRQELYEEAARKNIEGRSSMTKKELQRALRTR